MILLAMLVAGSVLPYKPLHLTQHQLDAISDRCSTPHPWLQDEHGWVHIHPDPKAKFEQIDCLLAGLKRDHAGYLGFEGNERAQ